SVVAPSAGAETVVRRTTAWGPVFLSSCAAAAAAAAAGAGRLPGAVVGGAFPAASAVTLTAGAFTAGFGAGVGGLIAGLGMGIWLEDGSGESVSRPSPGPRGGTGPVPSLGAAGPIFELVGRAEFGAPAPPRSGRIRGGISSSDGGAIAACVHGASA